MKAPDKIYVTTSVETSILSTRRHDYDVKYIRADALLEWAEEKKCGCGTSLSEYEMGYDDAVCDVIEQLIDKLTEL